MANPVLGWVTCPHCGEDATVHREAKGKRALYYRCYEGANGGCGTIQCRGPAGQAWVERTARWVEPGPQQDEAVQEAVEEARDEAAQQVRRERREAKKRGGLAGFARGLAAALTDEDD